MSRTKPYSASQESLSRPCSANDFFANGCPSSDAALCAELARVAYCSDARVQEITTSIGCTRCEAFHLRGTHAFLITHAVRDTTVLAFRGTEPDWQNVLTDARFWKQAWSLGGAVHTGFAEAILEIWPQIAPSLKPVGGRVLYTGHSLGAALATLAATLHPPTELFTFGSPLIGDSAFIELLKEVSVHRYVNCCDLVCQVPPAMFGYAHSDGLHYLNRHGELVDSPTIADIRADQNSARFAFLREHALKPGNVPVRDLADHAPINYVSALTM